MKQQIKPFHTILLLIPLTLSTIIHAQYSKNPIIPITTEGYEITVEKFAKIPMNGANPPRINCLTSAGDRIFVSTETGKIFEVISDGAEGYTTTLFLDVAAAIDANTPRTLVANGNWHAGLRGVAFHPNFASNGKFYTSIMESRPADTTGHPYLSDVPSPTEADGVVVEWTYDDTEQEADPTSYRQVIRIGYPYFDHTIKQIAFNPHAGETDEDYGLLYIAGGDGNPYYDPADGGLNNDGRGKIIRINPLQNGDDPYSVPATNPFVGDPDWLDEIYATGMRNPHNICFAEDNEGNVHFISANVGRDNLEEVNLVVAGENYGWSAREGTYLQLPEGGNNTGIDELPDTEADSGYTFPAAQWFHTDPVFDPYGGLSIAGGYIYTVEETSEKLYLSADFPESGLVMYNRLSDLLNAVTKLDPEDATKDEPEELTQATFYTLDVFFDDDNNPETPAIAKESMQDVINDDPDYEGGNRSDLRFGVDTDENIYITSKRNGWVYKVQSVTTGEVITNIAQTGGSTKGQLKVFPNPAQSQSELDIEVTEALTANGSIKVYTLSGELIFEKGVNLGETNFQIRFSELNLLPGLYKIQVETTGEHYVQSLIIE